ncbi:unnamed protein product [Allacma fusca]|uniref:Uncharacterized protein n=1 Tax=Allacma fusca TaxID=39272 RepID=A0A8J2KWT3_9HEXA|nr:unnamed protein product [Allacma fusca]
MTRECIHIHTHGDSRAVYLQTEGRRTSQQPIPKHSSQNIGNSGRVFISSSLGLKTSQKQQLSFYSLCFEGRINERY